LDRLLDHIARGPARRAITRKLERPEKEEEQDDVNHALVWLLQGLDQEALLGRYEGRLQRLRRQAKGAWKAEVGLGLDVCRFDDRLEVRAARKAISAQKPARARSPGVIHGEEHAVLFSPDGKHMATVSRGRVKVWRTSDWGLVARAEPDWFVEATRFSPDGKRL